VHRGRPASARAIIVTVDHEVDAVRRGDIEIAQPIIDREAPAGHLVLYPVSSLGMATPVTRGVRVVSFFWLQSDPGRAGAQPDMRLRHGHSGPG
jgi:hypothetical protein